MSGVERHSGEAPAAALKDLAQRPTALPRRVLLFTSIVCFLAWVFSVYDFTLFGTLLPKIARTFHWSTAHSTTISTYVTAGTFIVSIAVGPLLDRFGRKPALVITTVGAALTSGLTAFTPSALYLVGVRAFSGLLGGGREHRLPR